MKYFYDVDGFYIGCSLPPEAFQELKEEAAGLAELVHILEFFGDEVKVI